MSNTPRFVIGASNAETFEFPIVRSDARSLSDTAAVVAVGATSFPLALASALAWSERYTAAYDAKHKPSNPIQFFPKVRYNHTEEPEVRLAKKINGLFVWAESKSHGAWLPVEKLA